MQDIESDFWKEIFTHLQHRNMSRINAEKLDYSCAKEEINKFSVLHPELNVQVEDKGSFITWEAFITDNVKIRLFIQNQIKGSLLQFNAGDWIRIADAKFYNNPFSEIELLLQNAERYKIEIAQKKHKSAINEMQKKISIELIKAVCIDKFNNTDITWSVDYKNDSLFVLYLKKKDVKKEITVLPENIVRIVNELLVSF